MPKSVDKKKGAQKRHKAAGNASTPAAANDGSDAGSVPKRRKVEKKTKFALNDGIEMSKQLAEKVRTRKAPSSRQKRSSNNNNTPTLCGNGTPMPSLAELEKMYEDSDYDTDPDEKPTFAHTVSGPPDITPVMIPNLSPSKVASIASKVFQILDSGTVEILDDDGPAPPVIPQKRPKKSEVPYIVGCKDRPQIPQRPPKIRFGVGDLTYGVEYPSESSDEESENCPKKRRRGDGYPSISKSIFNPKSDEIAANLKANERLEPLFRKKSSSPDSCSTVSYECTDSPRPFCPLPSCSNDIKTILINEELFSKSLTDVDSSNHSQNDVEVIEVPIETIDVPDETTIKTPKPRTLPEDEDDSCMIIEPEIKNKNVSIIDLDERKYDLYNNLDTYDLSESCGNEADDIINIDEVIAENQALISKYKTEERTRDIVTIVDPTPEKINPKKNNVAVTSNTSTRPEIVISSNTSARPIEILSAPVTQVTNVQRSSGQATTQSNAPVQDTSNAMISGIVTSFFGQPASNTTCETIDLSNMQGTFISKLASWMSSVEHFIRGQSTPRAARIGIRTGDNSVIEIPSPGPSMPVATNNNMAPSAPTHTNRQAPSASAGARNHIDPRAPVHTNNHASSSHVSVSATNNLAPSVPVINSDRSNSVNGNSITISSGADATPPRTPGRGMECPICMDSLSGASIASTMCGHVFCMACIKTAIKANGRKCPTCRKQLKGAGFHQLFL